MLSDEFLPAMPPSNNTWSLQFKTLGQRLSVHMAHFKLELSQKTARKTPEDFSSNPTAHGDSENRIIHPLSCEANCESSVRENRWWCKAPSILCAKAWESFLTGSRGIPFSCFPRLLSRIYQRRQIYGRNSPFRSADIRAVCPRNAASKTNRGKRQKRQHCLFFFHQS